MNEMARLRWSVGIERATRSVAALGATPSPSPTIARDRNRPGSVPASNGTPAVAAAGAGKGRRRSELRQQGGAAGSWWRGAATAPRDPATAARTAPQAHAQGQHGAAAIQGGGVSAGDLAQQIAVEEGRLNQACAGEEVGGGRARHPMRGRRHEQHDSPAGAVTAADAAGWRRQAGAPATVGLHPKSWAMGMIATEMLTAQGESRGRLGGDQRLGGRHGQTWLVPASAGQHPPLSILQITKLREVASTSL